MTETASSHADTEAPPEILEACASEAEPTKFLEEYFAAGYSGWLAKKLGRRISLPQDRIDQAIIVLWYRACLLDTDRLLGQQSADANKPFFSDEGLGRTPSDVLFETCLPWLFSFGLSGD